ncbi:MAG TPA: glycoside hydrolase family 28 protein [Bryobacteraceae bacterium]|nr:glycoside hydrolase family 28 protein [Bryobacteraceae bacterium]
MTQISACSLLSALCLLTANAWGAGTVFNIMDYGARNDESASATAAIRSAIQAAKAAGGGTVYVPAGHYITGPIELASNLVFELDPGATLKFQASRADLSYTKGRLEGTECVTPVPLIGGHNLENVTIRGHGTITTDNAQWLNLVRQPDAAAARTVWTGIMRAINLKQPVPPADFKKAAPALRPSFIRTMESKNILIEGLHIVGSSMWTVHILYSQNVTIRDLIIETFPGANTDGMDIDSSQDVRISDCYLDTGDDAICLKSGKDADGLRVNRPTANIAITNCTVHHGHGAVVLGSETSGGFHNIVASNIVCQGTQKGVRIKSTRGRGGIIENVRFDHWTMDAVDEAINVTNYYTRGPEEPVSVRTPVFRNIAISNMTINHSPLMINVEGLPEMPVNGLQISNVIASGTVGMRAYNTEALELHNVQVNPEVGPAFLIRDSKDLELDQVSTRSPIEGSPVIRLDRCPGAIVRSSRAFSGTGTFLSVGPDELSSIVLDANALGKARRATEENPMDLWKAPLPVHTVR